MAAWCGNERSDDAHEVVVHVAGVAQRRSAGGHDGRDELVGLLKRRVLHMQAIGGNPG